MATVTDDRIATNPHRLSTLRLALTGSLSGALFYVICWIGSLVPGTPGHMYLELFTTSDVSTTSALVQGVVTSIIGGFVIGGLIAWVYNLLAFVDRR